MAVRLEIGPPRATITLDDPQRRNPLSTEGISQVQEALREASGRSEVRVVVFTGAGDRVFSAGGDLRQGFVDEEGRHEERRALVDLFVGMRACGKPTVARVNGHALAGGFGLAAACDIVVAVETARFGTPEIDVGLWPMMITGVLQRVMPRKALLELMMTGRLITAQEAQQLGVVSRVVPAAQLDATVDAVVETLASKSQAVLRLGRDAFYEVEDLDFIAALDVLHTRLGEVTATEDAREGVQAFLEKRAPRWKDR